MADVVRRTVRAWLAELPADVPVRHVALFGSAARGGATVTSDVDLFVWRPAGLGEFDPRWTWALATLTMAVVETTSRDVGVIEAGEDEAVAFVVRSPRLAERIAAEAVALAGDPLGVLEERLAAACR